MESQLSRIFRLSDITEKEREYKKLVDSSIEKLDDKALQTLVEHFINKEGNEQNGRTYTTPALLQYIIQQVGREQPDNADKSKWFPYQSLLNIAQHLVDTIKTKADDFPTQLMGATRLLSEFHQAGGDYKKAALVLSSFKFDGYRQQVEASANDKMKWHVDTCMLYLEIDDSAQAQQAVKRAHVLLNDITKNSELYVSFKGCYARVQDSQRNFLGAAREYHALSQYYGILDEASLLESLKCAVTCAILAPAGPDRMRRLATLYADERVSQLPNYQMLEKMFKERIIRKPDVEKFEKLLAAHQNAMMAAGQTVLSKAIIGHNILAVSKIYNNITFVELASLLAISPAKAEELARKMIEGKQMEGTIDQVQGIIEFQNRTGSLSAWDVQVNNTCLVVNDVLERIHKVYPQYHC